MKLNASQSAVIAEDGNALVVAGPGSGKTRVIIDKISHVLSFDPLARICAITFTRDAAEELQTRLRKKVGDSAFSRCLIGTFHSLIMKQLRESNMLGRVATPLEQSNFLRQALRSLGAETGFIHGYDEAVTVLESMKSTMERKTDWGGVRLIQLYQEILERNGMHDLYDVVRMATLKMRDGLLPPIGIGTTPCSRLMVDEYQDCDAIQYAWVMEHVQRGVVTIAVGDDDQTLYEWRHALGYSGMMQFKEEAKAVEYVLGDNYRSHAEILTHADNLIRCNQGIRVEKKLLAQNGPGGHVALIEAGNNAEQVDSIIELIERDVTFLDGNERFTRTVPTDSWAIISRNHRGLHLVELALRRKGIEYRRVAGNVMNQPFVDVYLALLKCLQAGHTSGIDTALGFLGASHDGIAELHHAFPRRFHHFLDGENIPAEAITNKEDLSIFNHFSASSAAWRNILRRGGYGAVAHMVCGYFNETVFIRDFEEEKREVLEGVANFVGDSERWFIKSQGRPHTLTERVDAIQSPLSDSSKKSKSGVMLHTMHSVKGLEFDSVGIFNVSNGTIPSKDRPDDVNDRRLLYVAMTRARKNLWISYRGGARSKFIDETGLSINLHSNPLHIGDTEDSSLAYQVKSRSQNEFWNT